MAVFFAFPLMEEFIIRNNAGSKFKPTSVNIGEERYERLTQVAIDISGVIRKQISGPEVLKFMIDNYADNVKDLWVDKARKAQQGAEGE